MSKCLKCKKNKCLIIECIYCNLNYCTRCLQPEIHNCENLKNCIESKRNELVKTLKPIPESKKNISI